MLLACGHTLVEMGSIVGVLEKKPHQAVLNLKRVEELAVLVVLEVDVELLVPEHTAAAGDVDHFQEKRVAHKIVGQHNGAHQPGVGPCGGIGVGHVEPGYGGINHLVGRFGNDPFDLFLVSGSEYTHGKVWGVWGSVVNVVEVEQVPEA